jgi:hypothetical protein
VAVAVVCTEVGSWAGVPLARVASGASFGGLGHLSKIGEFSNFRIFALRLCVVIDHFKNIRIFVNFRIFEFVFVL